jgi:L-lactate dehydrogenase (cytochrome)
MHAEIDRSQALLGARTLAELDAGFLAPAVQPLRHVGQHGPAEMPDIPASLDLARGERTAAQV